MVKTNKSPTMADLLTGQSEKNLDLFRGQVLEGKIIDIFPNEIILDLSSKAEGLLPKKEISDQMLTTLKVGESLEVLVVNPEDDNGQILVSIKPVVRLTKPMELIEKYKKNEIYKGKVTKITQFGVFVALEEGLEGLIHSSKLGPSDNFETGFELSVMVDEIDKEKGRIQLSPFRTSTKGLIYK